MFERRSVPASLTRSTQDSGCPNPWPPACKPVPARKGAGGSQMRRTDTGRAAHRHSPCAAPVKPVRRTYCNVRRTDGGPCGARVTYVRARRGGGAPWLATYLVGPGASCVVSRPFLWFTIPGEKKIGSRLSRFFSNYSSIFFFFFKGYGDRVTVTRRTCLRVCLRNSEFLQYSTVPDEIPRYVTRPRPKMFYLARTA